MANKILIAFFLLLFAFSALPLQAMTKKIQDSNTNVTTKVETQGNKRIITRILRISIGETYRGKKISGKNSCIYEFNKRDYEVALKSDKLTILFFYDDTSPACKDEFTNMSAAFDQLESKNVIGFKVNFEEDKANELEKKLIQAFKVPAAQTKIFIKNGETLLKTSTPFTEKEYLDKIAEFLK